MGRTDKQQPNSRAAFTRFELAVVLACVCLLGLVVLPMLGRSRAAGSEAVCMNNLRNLGRAFLVYSDQNGGYVPNEGNITVNVISSGNATAWYNAAVLPEYPSMKSLYSTAASTNFPVPASPSVYSCPGAAPPPAGQPSVAWAFFMYGENNCLCVNSPSATRPQTRFPNIPKASVTVMIGEVDDSTYNSATPSLSGVQAAYTATRHDGFGLFTMCDGSLRALTTNQFVHPLSSAAQEWYVNGADSGQGYTSWPVYWWPTPTTPQ